MNSNLQTHTARRALSPSFGAAYATARGFSPSIRDSQPRSGDWFEPVPEEVHNDELRELLEARLAREAPDVEGFHVRMS